MNVKNELRAEVRAGIAALPDDYIAYSDGGIFKNITALDEFIHAGKLMLYYSVGREIDTLKIAEKAFAMGKTVTFPYCYRGGIMEARVVSSLQELKPAMLGIPAPGENAPVLAPEELELIIVPALAFDHSGYRLGYGGGYYDRFLSGIPAFKAGIARERLLRDSVPREPHDVAVDCLITEGKTQYLP